MKNSKKIIALLLAVVTVVSTVSFSASAAFGSIGSRNISLVNYEQAVSNPTSGGTARFMLPPALVILSAGLIGIGRFFSADRTKSAIKNLQWTSGMAMEIIADIFSYYLFPESWSLSPESDIPAIYRSIANNIH